MMNQHERRAGEIERAVRAQLAQLQARYDGGAVSQAVYATIRALEIELAWLKHRGLQQLDIEADES
jgi:hypothetical protein